jgi:hypothetical protein
MCLRYDLDLQLASAKFSEMSLLTVSLKNRSITIMQFRVCDGTRNMKTVGVIFYPSSASYCPFVFRRVHRLGDKCRWHANKSTNKLVLQVMLVLVFCNIPHGQACMMIFLSEISGMMIRVKIKAY